MKNSKRFSTAAWQEGAFLSATQLTTCRDLFLGGKPQLTLSVVNLSRLNAELGGGTLASAYLSPAEQERLAAFTFAKRHLEWLGGRIAAKHATLALLANSASPPSTYQDLVVETHASGRPFLRWRADTRASLPEISISHSGNYAGALAVPGQNCGLDLQRITPKVLKIRDRFASNAELALLLALPLALAEATALTLLWSAKEAFRKAIPCQPLAGFSDITLLSLAGNPQGGMIGHFACPRLTPAPLPAFLFVRADYAAVITVVGGPS